jgi:glycosyltransferase involved in cell wall biosynthesis
MPKISVCIPTYNSARYLGQAINSVLQQEYNDYELVVCDNASTDGSAEICGGFNDARLRYLRFEDRTNQAGNFNRCLSEARGEYLTLLHADDFILPDFLADRVQKLEDRPTAGFVFGAVHIVDQTSVVTRTSSPWPEDREFGKGELLDSLLLGCIVSPPSLMVRRSSSERLGPFRTDLTWGHDWEWTIRLAEQCCSCYTSRALAAYRVHGESGTAEQIGAAQNGYQERLILRQVLARLAASDGRFRKLRRPAFRALSRRHMFFAESTLLSGQNGSVVRNNLTYAALADLRMLIRPTFWALLLGSMGPMKCYERYRAFRSGAARGHL